MRRIIYQPTVKAFVNITTDSGPQTIELSNDIIGGQVNLRLNAMSDITLYLQNKYSKYTGQYNIRPMDRIVVLMSRVTDPFLVFSGYVDEAPYFQLYPDQVTLKASDTLKLIEYTYFDPGLPFMQQFFANAGFVYNPTSGQILDPSANFGNFDVSKGIGHILYDVLTKIGQWPSDSVHIKPLPNEFLKHIANLLTASIIQEEADYAQLEYRLGMIFSAPPDTTSNAGAIAPVTGATVGQGTNDTLSSSQLQSVWIQAGGNPTFSQLAAAVALAESSGNVDNKSPQNSNGTYDLGLWQINTVHTQYDQTQLLSSPSYNAKAAISISDDGSDWHAWSTAWTDGALGTKGGTYDPTGNSPAGAYYQQIIKGVNVNSTGAGTFTPSPPTSTPATQTVLRLVKSQIGVTEHPPGSNSGPQVNLYLSSVGLPPGAPWCAAFVSYILDKAGLGNLVPKTGSVQVIYDYAVQKGWTYAPGTTIPKPGDLAVYNWSGATTADVNVDQNHIGFVVSVNANGNPNVIAGNEANSVGAQPEKDLSDVVAFIHLPVSPAIIGSPITGGIVGTSAGGETDAGSNSQITVQSITSNQNFLTGVTTLTLPTTDSTLAYLLTGERALSNDISLMEWVQEIVQASGRVFRAAPNGDFYAFFPDYFGMFARTPYFYVSETEMLDLQIQINDTELVTHLYAIGPIIFWDQISPYDSVLSQIASVQEEAFKFFMNLSSPDDPVVSQPFDDVNDKQVLSAQYDFDPTKFLQKYGARPYNYELQNVRNPVLLWMAAWMQFALMWSNRFPTSASFTYMPELFPGGIVNLANRITMFVNAVTHNFDMETGFQTTAELVAPALLQNRGTTDQSDIGQDIQ